MVYFNSCKKADKNVLRVAVASNLAPPFKEITSTFNEKTGIQIETIIGSSGKLAAQILEGAPYDLFISADPAYLDTLYNKQMMASEPVLFMEGTLILWISDTSYIDKLEGLSNEKIERIAIPNPKIAPYGKAAKQLLNNLGIWEDVIKKLIYGESVSQTNQFIMTRAVQAGFTSKSSMLIEDIKSGDWIEIKDTIFDPIVHGIGILKPLNEQSRSLLEFLKSENNVALFQKYGYKVY